MPHDRITTRAPGTLVGGRASQSRVYTNRREPDRTPTLAERTRARNMENLDDYRDYVSRMAPSDPEAHLRALSGSARFAPNVGASHSSVAEPAYEQAARAERAAAQSLTPMGTLRRYGAVARDTLDAAAIPLMFSPAAPAAGAYLTARGVQDFVADPNVTSAAMAGLGTVPLAHASMRALRGSSRPAAAVSDVMERYAPNVSRSRFQRAPSEGGYVAGSRPSPPIGGPPSSSRVPYRGPDPTDPVVGQAEGLDRMMPNRSGIPASLRNPASTPRVPYRDPAPGPTAAGYDRFMPNTSSAGGQATERISGSGIPIRGTANPPQLPGEVAGLERGGRFASNPEISALEHLNTAGGAATTRGVPYGTGRAATRLDDLVDSMQVVDDAPTAVNASGESAASLEALSRGRGMAQRGEKFVVVNRAGQSRELLGPEAVDYVPRSGEAFGVLGPEGFQFRAGTAPRAPVRPAAPPPAATPPPALEALQSPARREVAGFSGLEELSPEELARLDESIIPILERINERGVTGIGGRPAVEPWMLRRRGR